MSETKKKDYKTKNIAKMSHREIYDEINSCIEQEDYDLVKMWENVLFLRGVQLLFKLMIGTVIAVVIIGVLLIVR